MKSHNCSRKTWIDRIFGMYIKFIFYVYKIYFYQTLLANKINTNVFGRARRRHYFITSLYALCAVHIILLYRRCPQREEIFMNYLMLICNHIFVLKRLYDFFNFSNIGKLRTSQVILASSKRFNLKDNLKCAFFQS